MSFGGYILSLLAEKITLLFNSFAGLPIEKSIFIKKAVEIGLADDAKGDILPIEEVSVNPVVVFEYPGIVGVQKDSALLAVLVMAGLKIWPMVFSDNRNRIKKATKDSQR